MTAPEKRPGRSLLPGLPNEIVSQPSTPGVLPGGVSVGSGNRPLQLQTAALHYAELGWAVFPCNGKAPATANGFKDATCDPGRVAAWWPTGTQRNIGGVAPAGCYWLDIDPEKARAVLEPLMLRLAGLHTPVQRSGGGGMHFLLRGPVPKQTALRKAWSVTSGIDVKEPGKGYVILAPSVHPETGAIYEWAMPPDTSIGETPDWLLRGVLTVANTPTATDESWAHRSNIPLEDVRAALAKLDPDCDNDTWVRYGQALKLEFGEDGWAMWHEWSATGEKKYDGEDDCRRRWDSFGNNVGPGSRPVTVRTILRDARPDAGQAIPIGEGLRLYNPLDRPPQSLPYMLREPLWLPDISEQVILFGKSETFKSVMTEGICAYLAAGVSLDGETIEPHVVVYAAEEAPMLFDNNLHAWRMHFEKALRPDVANHARANLEAGYLQRIEGHIEGLTDRRAEEIVWLVREQQRKLASAARPVVVLDPVAEVMPGEESKTDDMRRYIGAGRLLQRKTGALVVHVHHVGHGDTGRERGSSTLPAAMYARYEVRRPVETAYELEVRCRKHKGRAKPAPSRWLVSQVRLMPAAADPTLDPPTGVVVEHRGDAPLEIAHADARAIEQERLLARLVRAYAEDPKIGRPRLMVVLECGGSSKVDTLREVAVRRGLLVHGKGAGRAGYVLTDAGRALSEIGPDED